MLRPVTSASVLQGDASMMKRDRALGALRTSSQLLLSFRLAVALADSFLTTPAQAPSVQHSQPKKLGCGCDKLSNCLT